MNLFLMRIPYVINGDPGNVAGPYEFIGTMLIFAQFIFTAMMVIGKRQRFKIIASFLTALFSGCAFVMYYLNQATVGNSLDARVLSITAAGVVYGIVIGVLRINKRKHLMELHEVAAEAEARRNVRGE